MLRKSDENRFTLESTITLKEKREALVLHQKVVKFYYHLYW